MTRILVVCTANICRSPLAAALLARASDEHGIDAEVRSAGLMTGGHVVPADGLRVAREHGLDLTGHVSSQLDQWTAQQADLILTMTREHSRTILADLPELWSRTFTLIGYRHWLGALGSARPGGARTAGGLGHQLGLLSTRRQRTELLGGGPDDVPDPIGQRLATWRRVADLLAGETSAVAEGLATLLASPAREAR